MGSPNAQGLVFAVTKKKYLPFLVFLPMIYLMFFSGCASDDMALQNMQELAKQEREINLLKAELKQAKTSTKFYDEQKYADLQTQVDSLTSEIHDVNAKSHDIIQRLNEIDAKIIHLQQRVQNQNTRLAKLEKVEATPPPKPKVPAPIQNDITGTASKLEVLYDDAYSSFTQGDYETARKKFALFLKKYPKSVYSDNARFWIGETYYVEGDFERAILEYEKVRRKYPRGDKVPSALLKEGMAFLKLNDKADGRLILKRLIHKYPRTDQAKIAKRILRKIH